VLDASRREALLPPPVAIRTKVVYYLLHGPYDLLSLLFRRLARTGDPGLSSRSKSSASQMPATQFGCRGLSILAVDLQSRSSPIFDLGQ
jgi:hypothetical protein